MDHVAVPVELSRGVLDALESGATVVTGNMRAARTLRRAFDHRNREKGLSSWETASVMAWESWTTGLWRTLLLEGHAEDLLLSRTQEHVVWRSIITTDPERRQVLRSVDSLAELAVDAWLLVGQYKGFGRLRGLSHNFETRSFLRWSGEFERRCRSQRWLSAGLLEEALSAAIQSGALRIPGEIALVGFDELTPARQSLIESVRAKGGSIEQLETAQVAEDRIQVRADDESEEMAAAAWWARRRLQSSPGAKLGIIVPALATRHSPIDRSFRHVLAPDLEDIAAPNHVAPFEFSIGLKLAETPLVRVALDLLHWVLAPLPIERVSALLVSPLFAMERGDSDARAIFDAFELRKAKLLRPEVTLRWMMDAVARSRRRKQPAGLLDALRNLDRAASRHNVAGSIRSFSEWADVIRDLLSEAQWRHSGAEDSVEFQTRKRWEAALDELATLDFDGSHVGFFAALEALERLARLTTFAPESRDVPVQILGPLEAAGLSFDALWFMGAGDLTWPVRPAANPLLPWALQVELAMPGANTQRDDARDRRMMQRIADSASFTVFSYAAEMEAGKQRPSPVLEFLSLTDASIESIAPRESTQAAAPLEAFTDTAPIPVPEQTSQGGAEVLRLQAACGFRAFAEKRLSAAELKSIELGMDAAERGNVVHRTLEHFWDEVKTQSELKAMTKEQRDAALNRAMEYGLRRAAELSTTEWDTAYVEVQRRRLRTLLTSWFEIELRRDPFEVELSEKEFKDVTIGPLQLSVRVDRIDATAAGDVIIDYKTGRAKPSDWLSTRPDAPQLPLYAVLTSALQPEVQLGDIAFANIHAGSDAAFESYTRRITATSSKEQRRQLSISEQLDQWKFVLEDLAEQFHRGDASVNPKKYPLTCKSCAQRTFCRVDPATTNMDEELDDQTANDTGNW